jgi:hypothetical protein
LLQVARIGRAAARTQIMVQTPKPPRAHWLRLALIESIVAAVGVLALLALLSIDERTRALMPFIPH